MYEDRMTSGWPFGSLKSKPWRIEKERRLTCFGSPGYVMQWDHWDSYDTRAEAEEALKRLNSRRDPTSRERYQIVENRDTQWVLK